MGDPKKLRKKLERPRHPYNKTRLEEEIVLMGKYGLRNKKEIWRAQTVLRKYRARARASLALSDELRNTELRVLTDKLFNLGIISNETSSIDSILSLNVDFFLRRRLQSYVVELGLARTPWQARQMIVHGHIAIHGKKVNTPSYHVKREDEENISFSKGSPFEQGDHPALSIANPTKLSG